MSTDNSLNGWSTRFEQLVSMAYDGFVDIWSQDEDLGPPPIVLSGQDKVLFATIEMFMERGLAPEDVIRNASVALKRDSVAWDGKWKYFCGVCWTVIRRKEAERDAAAQAAGVTA